MVELWPEATGFEHGPGDVVGEGAEAAGGGAEVFEPAVDGLGHAAGRAGSVKVRRHVSGPLDQGPASGIVTPTESTSFVGVSARIR